MLGGGFFGLGYRHSGTPRVDTSHLRNPRRSSTHPEKFGFYCAMHKKHLKTIVHRNIWRAFKHCLSEGGNQW